MNKNVFITGVNGFIGRNLCRFLLKKNYSVFGIDNFFSSNKNDIKKLKHKNFLFIEKSILDSDIFKFFPKEIDTVIHLAAQTSVQRSIREPDLNNKINVEGFKNVLMQTKKKNIKNFFFASSSAVYGDVNKLPLKESFKKLNPLSPYASSKFDNEKFSKLFFPTLNVVGLRLFNMYGDNIENLKHSNYAAVIPKFINNFKKNKVCDIYGDGQALRDFCYVEDLCYFIELLMKIRKLSGIFNFCTGKPVSINLLFEKIKKIYSKIQSNIKYPEPNYLKAQEGEIRFSYGSNNLIKKKFGYETKTSLECGLKKIIK